MTNRKIWIGIFVFSFLISIPLSFLGLNLEYPFEYLVLKFFFWFILGGVVLGILFSIAYKVYLIEE